jgi:hypothetical protein
MTETKIVPKNELQDLPDQYIFFILALTGAFAILFLKSIGIPQMVVTAVPIALIIGYAMIVQFPGRFRLREDKIGDNCYYLGFIYTLVSLGYALYVYDPSGAGVETIINNFGIAIATTIVGLVFRVFFNQMRMDIDEFEGNARRDLTQAALTLRTELNTISSQMADFKRKIVQIVEEGLAEVQKKSQETLEANVGAFNQATRDVIGVVDTTLKAYQETSRRMGEVAELTVVSVEQLAKRVEAVNVSPEMVSAKLAPVIAQLGEIVSGVASRETSSTKALQSLKRALEGAVANAVALEEVLQRAGNGAKTGFDQLLSGAAKTAQASDEALANTRRLVAEIGAAVASFREEIAAAIVVIAEDGRRFAEQTKAQTTAVQEQREIADEHMRAMRAIAQEGREAVGEVQANLVSLTRAIIEQTRPEKALTEQSRA